MNTPNRNSGFTMLEALVSLAVLSVGLLGVGALSIQTVKTGHSAQLRTKAVFLAADMADRIRSNKLALSMDNTAYAANIGDGGVDGKCTDDVDDAGAEVPAAEFCSPPEMADHDIFLWKDMVADARIGLPSGTASIERTGTTPVRFTISIFWNEKAVAQRYDLRMQVLPPPVVAGP